MVLWVFGYGSLIWKAGFNYNQRIVGFIKDYVRVFHQGSTDHRGTNEAPGRTVTLQKIEDGITWGVAYCIDEEEEEERRVIAYLEWREKQYDVRELVNFYTVDNVQVPALKVLVYIASEDPTRNVNYLGPAPLHDIAKQIATAVGPSGPNYEYLFRLEEALHEIGVVDEGLTMLAQLVKKLMMNTSDGHASSSSTMVGHHIHLSAAAPISSSSEQLENDGQKGSLVAAAAAISVERPPAVQALVPDGFSSGSKKLSDCDLHIIHANH